MIRASPRWQSKPDSFDSLYASRCYPMDNRYGIPLLEHSEHGFSVIPTISWSTTERYPFCFPGVPRHHMVAGGTIGVALSTSARQRLKRPLICQLFIDGYRQMGTRLQSTAVSAQLRVGSQFASVSNAQL